MTDESANPAQPPPENVTVGQVTLVAGSGAANTATTMLHSPSEVHRAVHERVAAADPENTRDAGGATFGAHFMPEQEMIVSPDEPRILTSIGKIKEVLKLESTFWFALLTFCAGIAVSSWPQAMDARVALDGGRAPTPEASRQLQLFQIFGGVGLLALLISVPRAFRFRRAMKRLQRGERYSWNKQTGEARALPPTPARPPNRVARMWKRCKDFVTYEKADR